MFGNFFIPRQWRLARIVYIFMILEFPFTVANLTLFGVASPNLYREILWREGGERGFNSEPSTILYAYANYRPVKIPMVWSSFNTQYNLYIGVVCMFFYLIKMTGWFLHVFYPILSLPLHIALLALWAVSVSVQTGSDTIDPQHENHGAPWYITKNCNIVEDKTIRGYCMQAKSAFAVSICMLVIYAFHVLFALYSLYPTRAARQEHAIKAAERKAQKEKWAAANSAYDNDLTPEEQWQHMWELQQLPRTPGTATHPTGPGWGEKMPVTPRTRAFGALEGNLDAVVHQHQNQNQYQHQGYLGVEESNGNAGANGLGVVQHYPEPYQPVSGYGNGYEYPAPPPPQGIQHNSTYGDEYPYDGNGKGTAV